MDALTKGLSFLHALKFAEQHFGADGSAQLIGSLSPEDQGVLASVIPMGWYDLALYTRLIHTLARVHGGGDLQIIEDYGRYCAKLDIGTLYKLMFRITSPGLIFDQGLKLWPRFHNTGKWQVDRGDKHATGILSDWGCVDAALCRELVGYLETTLAHGNCARVKVEHPTCRSRGARECMFTCSWQ